MKYVKSFVKRWDSYKYRFVPWMKANIKTQRTTRVIEEKADKIISDEEVLYQIRDVFKSLATKGKLESRNFFNLKIEKSSIEDAGLGVFLQGCSVPKGTVVGIYPGTVYLPYESIFFQSISNPYIFKCSDGVLIDGNNKGLSKIIFRSCEGRDRVSHLPSADTTWLNPTTSTCLLNVGQFVNNQSLSKPSNVCYQEFDFPEDFEIYLKRFVPNIYFQSSNSCRGMRTVILVSTREILIGEELFSTYYTVIKT